MLNFFDVLIGGSLLVAGRKLFWLFVGAIGFVIGLQLAQKFFPGPEWRTLLIGLGLGIFAAVLTIMIETIAITFAGFLAGGYLFMLLAGAFGLEKTIPAWILFIIGGIIGASLIVAVFDWALIIISSILGASMISQSLHFRQIADAIFFFFLLIIGIVIQSSDFRKNHQLKKAKK